MAYRTSDARRVPGNPLAGVLGTAARAARSTRGPRVRPEPGPAGPQGERGPVGPQGPPGAAPVAAVLTTDATGVAVWTFPVAFAVAPVVVAIAASATALRTATLGDVTHDGATLHVWDAVGSPVAGATVHVAAFGAA